MSVDTIARRGDLCLSLLLARAGRVGRPAPPRQPGMVRFTVALEAGRLASLPRNVVFTV